MFHEGKKGRTQERLMKQRTSSLLLAISPLVDLKLVITLVLAPIPVTKLDFRAAINRLYPRIIHPT